MGEPYPAHRQDFLRLAADHVSYVELADDSKIPDTKVYKTVTYTRTLPHRTNVGAHPEGRTVIFDFDTGSGVPPAKQLTLFKKDFALDLTDSLTVETPSGGFHVYTVWPDEVPLPGNWKFKKFSRLGLDLSGDLRSAETKGHAVMPGSVVDGVEYTVSQRLPVKRLSQQDVETFSDLYLMLTQVPTSSRENPPTARNPRELSKNHARPTTKNVNSLRSHLARSHYTTWHSQRAYVYAVLNCCHSEGTIVDYWRALDICRDKSQGDRVVSTRELWEDVARLSPSPHQGKYCLRTGPDKPSYVEEGLSEEELRSRVLKKLKLSTGWRSPRVVDLELAVKALTGGRQGPSKYYPLALALLEDFVQPWMNFGVSRIMLADVFLSDFYSVSMGDVKQAKKLLMRKGILEVAVKQSTGRTTVFRLRHEFENVRLSKVLVAMKLTLGSDVMLDARTGDFYDSVTREVLGSATSLDSGGEFHSLLAPRLSQRTVVEYLLETP